MSQPKILRKKTKVQPGAAKPTAEGIFKQAESFRQAAHVLSMQATQMVGFHPQLFFPKLVCEAFSLELFLKCLALLENASPTQTHDLEDLFNQLSNDSKASIRAHSQGGLAQAQQAVTMIYGKERRSGKPVGATPAVDFEYALSSSKKAFESYRYVHEKSTAEPPSNWFGTPILGAVVRRVLELKPEWKDFKFVDDSKFPSASVQPGASPTP